VSQPIASGKHAITSKRSDAAAQRLRPNARSTNFSESGNTDSLRTSALYTGVAYGEGIYVAVGWNADESAVVSVSPDGVRWDPADGIVGAMPSHIIHLASE
jgi:sRNA-binding protein